MFYLKEYNGKEDLLGEVPIKIYAAAQKNREIPMGQQELSQR